MIVNADRQGPKDMLDLATKANALKGFMDTKRAVEASNGNVSPELQKRHDDAFEELMDVHGNDPQEVAATTRYVQERLAKGKGH